VTRPAAAWTTLPTCGIWTLRRRICRHRTAPDTRARAVGIDSVTGWRACTTRTSSVQQRRHAMRAARCRRNAGIKEDSDRAVDAVGVRRTVDSRLDGTPGIRFAHRVRAHDNPLGTRGTSDCGPVHLGLGATFEPVTGTVRLPALRFRASGRRGSSPRRAGAWTWTRSCPRTMRLACGAASRWRIDRSHGLPLTREPDRPRERRRRCRRHPDQRRRDAAGSEIAAPDSDGFVDCRSRYSARLPTRGRRTRNTRASATAALADGVLV
jgi:hypothetical protein